METLWKLYQQRLNQLNQQFILLLSQFQNNQLFTSPELAKYRIEYLGSMLQKTLKNNQEKLILKLYQQIDQLTQTNSKLHQEIAQLNSRSLDMSGNENYFEFTKQKSLGSTKVSTVYRRDKEETDSFMESCSSKFSRRHQSKGSNLVEKRKQKQSAYEKGAKTNANKYGSIQKDEQQDQQLQMMKMSFKYLKL